MDDVKEATFGLVMLLTVMGISLGVRRGAVMGVLSDDHRPKD
jgi:uncharacterized membrane protein